MKTRYYFLFLFLLIYFVDNYTKQFYYYEDLNEGLYHNGMTTYISEDFKSYKVLNIYDYLNRKIDKFSIKINLDENKYSKKIFYMTIVSDIDSLTFSNTPFIRQNNLIIVKIDQNRSKELIFNYKYNEFKIGEFRFNTISEFEYKYLLPYEGILYGLAYGIIFSAFLYYLVIYLSTYRKCFLYYSMMQLFVLLSLIGFAFFSFQAYPTLLGQKIVDIFETLGFMFTLFFIKEILQTKKKMIEINKIIDIFITLNILDLLAIIIYGHSILYNTIPFYIIFLLATFAGITAIYNGDRYSKVYTLGWVLMSILIFISERHISYISSIYTIHIAAPLESLIFSFALAFMLKNLVKKQNEQEKLLIHKSKLASMGEMINNIAHQWRQPLMHLGYINMNLEMASSNNEFEKEYFVKKIKESNSQIKFMSKTIDDFGDFYKIEKEKQEFSILNACNLAINIISPTLKKKKITLNLSVENDSKIKGYENEYAQVMLNFLTNCVDIFVIRKIENPTINITIDNINNKTITKVCDNAGGIEEKNLKNIFEANFTTKQRGSGIGLYMSQVIIQSHFDGNIYVSNINKGVCFSIEV